MHPRTSTVLRGPGGPEEVTLLPHAPTVWASVLCASAQNPTNKRPGLPSAGPEPAYSEQQRKSFASGNAWVGCEDTSLLDVEGTEMVLIGAREQQQGGSGGGAPCLHVGCGGGYGSLETSCAGDSACGASAVHHVHYCGTRRDGC